MNREGWSSPWAQRVERRPRGVVDVVLERQEAARGSAHRRRGIASRLALAAALGTVASPYVPYGWIAFWLAVAAGSRAVWIWVLAARDDFEGSLNMRDVLVEGDPD